MTQERGNQNTIYYLFKKSPNEFTQNASIEYYNETRLLEGDVEEPGKETTKNYTWGTIWNRITFAIHAEKTNRISVTLRDFSKKFSILSDMFQWLVWPWLLWQQLKATMMEWQLSKSLKILNQQLNNFFGKSFNKCNSE